MNLSLEALSMLPAPYPLAIARHLFAEDDLRQLRAAWPGEQDFHAGGGGYVKQALAPSHPAYAEALAIPIWASFAEAIRRPSFYDAVRAWCAPVDDIKSTWFEFTLMSTGCTLPPHTDAASKVITMIIWMMSPGEWHQDWGGGLDVYDTSHGTLASYDYEDNSAILLARTADSWHGIAPLRCPPTARRRTLTVCFGP